jgi:hypothetical protein
MSPGSKVKTYSVCSALGAFLAGRDSGGAFLAGRDFNHATPAVTWGLGFSSLVQRTTPVSRLFLRGRRNMGPIWTRILPSLHDLDFLIIHDV